MAYGTIDVKLRPIKFAFLVNPSDKAALMEAIGINTFQWGGMFNPIIPAFKRLPKIWENGLSKNLNSRKILGGYLEAFDPDFVVSLGKCKNQKFDIGNRRLISGLDILGDVEKEGSPNFGLGLFDILDYFTKKELTFLRRDPLDVCVPSLKKQVRPFLASVFGYLPQHLYKIFKNNYGKILGAKNPSCSIFNYYDLLTPKKLFLRSFSSLYLNSIYMGGCWRGSCIFLLDASKTLDIIDYWNLRAIGWTVLPIAIRSSKLDVAKRLALNFIEKNFYPDRFNPNIYHKATLLKSRSITEDEAKSFMDSLGIPKPEKPGECKIIFQHWYPRIWEEWARDIDRVVCCELKANSTQYDIPNYKERLNFKTLDPKFISRFLGKGEPRFVNEIDLRVYDDKETFAEVIPEGGEKLARAIGGFDFHGWRFSKKGITYLAQYPNRTMHLKIPKSEHVFSEWLKLKKWNVELSASGHIAKQMLIRLGGTWGVSTLASEGIIKLLEKLNGGKTIKEKTLRAEISKIANMETFPRHPQRLLQRLLEVQMFRLGIEIQCPICRQRSWYSIKDSNYDLQCPKCIEQFNIPSHSPEEIKWSYKAFGPFSLPNQAYGVYSVLLTLRFFSKLIDAPTTPMMSFIAKRNGKEIEADLGLFYQESEFGSPKTEVIFAECKTYNNFEKEDAQRMILLSQYFPGAILVFSTLRKSLREREKRLLRPVVNRGRRYWKAERPFNPVLILTGIELFTDFGPPRCWKDVGGRHTSFAKNLRVRRDLLHLCDITQQLYLDMKPLYEWLEDRWKKQRQKRTINKNLQHKKKIIKK